MSPVLTFTSRLVLAAVVCIPVSSGLPCTAQNATQNATPSTTTANAPQPANVQNPALREELLAMDKTDQNIRNRSIDWQAQHRSESKQLIREWTKIDKANRTRMKQIVAQYGWPGYKMVGRDGANAAWLLVQHADPDPAFQVLCLPLIRKAAENGDASPVDAAYLTDRVLLKQGRPQRYGTQLIVTPQHDVVPRPTEDPAHLDERRRALGLPSMAEYIKYYKEQVKISQSADKTPK